MTEKKLTAEAIGVVLNGHQYHLFVAIGLFRDSAVEAKVAQNTKVILSNAILSVTNEAHSACLNVFHAVKEVVKDAVQAEEHGVDGEIAAQRVQLPVGREFHFGMPTVGDFVDSQSCHLKVGAVENPCSHCAVRLTLSVENKNRQRTNYKRRVY